MSIERLQNLLTIPSYSGEEEQIQRHIHDQLKGDGLEPFFQNENVIVKIPGIDNTRAFIFNSHSDVVHIGDPEEWTHDPWGAEIYEGKIYGRGASDMKSGLYATLELAKTHC